MDFSLIMNDKFSASEINVEPIPRNIRDQMSRSGLWICSFYSNVKSPVKDSPAPRKFKFYVLTHLIGGKGFYWTPEREKPEIISPGAGIIATPGQTNSYAGYKDYFHEDSIAFMGPSADALYNAGVLRDGLIQIGTARRLLPIIEKLKGATLASQLEANALLLNLIFELYHENRKREQTPGSESRIHLLIRELKHNISKWWTVSEMAAYCNISENQLRRIFRETTGMSPKSYIETVKMRRGVELLCGSKCKISEVAANLGYVDQYHFIRRFKKVIGIPPARYRREFSSMS